MLRSMETRTRTLTKRPSEDTDTTEAKTRQFFWGLSSGIIILGVASALVSETDAYPDSVI